MGRRGRQTRKNILMKKIFIILLLFTASDLFAQKQGRITVNFDFNKYDITTTAAARLDSLVASFPVKTSGITIALYGHCDSIGSYEYNDELSQKRVKAVKNYLTGKGLEPAVIIKEEGFGKRNPLNNNASDHERFLNRRVELAMTLTEEKPVEKQVEKITQKTFTKTIEDTTTRVGTTITLQNLNFVGGMHYLLPQSAPVLNELLEVMKQNPRLVIAIEGHVCCLPDKNDGVDLALGTANLSEMRAKTVYDYLLKNGIAPDRMSYKGFGHQFPLAPFPERSAEEQINNRRVEIRIISK